MKSLLSANLFDSNLHSGVVQEPSIFQSDTWSSPPHLWLSSFLSVKLDVFDYGVQIDEERNGKVL